MNYTPELLKAFIDHVDSRATRDQDIEITVEISKDEKATAVNVKHDKTDAAMRVEATSTGYNVETLHDGQADYIGDVHTDEIAAVFDRFVDLVKDGYKDALTKPVRESVVRLAEHWLSQKSLGRLHDDVEIEFNRNDVSDCVTLKVKRGAVSAKIEVSDVLAVRIGGRKLDQMTILDASDFKKNNTIERFSLAVHNVASKQCPVFVTRNGNIRKLWAERPVTTDQLIASVYGA